MGNNRTPTAESSTEEIARLLARLYDVISFEENGEPDWSGLAQVFSPRAHIARITPEGTDHLAPARFVEMTRHLLEIGAYTAFHEIEVARHVQRFGDVAQVWSVYETRRHRAARTPLTRGVNSIQLIRENGSWCVLGLLWDESQATPHLDVAHALLGGN